MAGSSEIDTSSVQQQMIQNGIESSELDGTSSVIPFQTDLTRHTERDTPVEHGTELHTGTRQELHAVYKRQLHQLEKEVNDLEVRLDVEKKKSFGKEEDFKLWLKDKDVSSMSLAEVQEQISKVEEMLDLNQKLTGIQFDKTNWTPLQQDGSMLSRQHFVEGYCNGSPFQVTYDIVEDFTGESVENQATEITELTLYVEDQMEATIGNQLQQLTEDRELPGFFTILVSYLKWQTERERVMNLFLQKYPNLVRREQPGSAHCLVIENKDRNRPSFVLDWGLKTTPLYRIERHLSLAFKVPQKMFEGDKSDTLSSTPDMFITMVKKAGVEKAIETLVHMVSSEEEDPS